jgi:hypothetical protein
MWNKITDITAIALIPEISFRYCKVLLEVMIIKLIYLKYLLKSPFLGKFIAEAVGYLFVSKKSFIITLSE